MAEATSEISYSEELEKRVEKGERLETDDRRKLIAFWMGTRADLSNMDIARALKVSESLVRKDKDLIRKQAAEEVSKDDIGLVIADIKRRYERFQTEVERGLKKCSPGSNAHLAYLKASMDYEFKVTEALQNLGIYPKNLGNLTKTQFIFKAHVAKGGGVDNRPLESKEELKVIEMKEQKQLGDRHMSDDDVRIREELYAEFEDVRESGATPQLKTDDGSSDNS